MQGRTPPTRKARIQHHQPWLVEPLVRDGVPTGVRSLDEQVEEGTTGMLSLVEAWLETLACAGTRTAYRRDVRGCLAFLGVRTNTDLLAVRHPQVRRWRDELQRRLDAGQLVYASCKRRMAAATSLFDYLNREGHIIRNPVRGIRRPRAKETSATTSVTPSRCPLSICPVRANVKDVESVSVSDWIAHARGASAAGHSQLTLW